MPRRGRLKLRRKQDQLQSALEGSIGQHQRFMLGHLLQHIEFVERQIEQLSAEIEARDAPHEPHMESLLCQRQDLGREEAQRTLHRRCPDLHRPRDVQARVDREEIDAPARKEVESRHPLQAYESAGLDFTPGGFHPRPRSMETVWVGLAVAPIAVGPYSVGARLLPEACRVTDLPFRNAKG